MSAHASAGCSLRSNTTRLEPPATETPGVPAVGPGIGAVAHSTPAGSRRRNSPMFQGPVM